MTLLLKAILLGIIQGLCEFLPVSSSGHLALANSLFSLPKEVDDLALNVLLHIGTLAAVVLLFRKDIWDLIKSLFSLLGKVFKGNFKLSEYTLGERFVVLLLVAVLPLIPASLLSGSIEILMGYPIVIGAILIVNAFMLYFSEKFGKGEKSLEEVKPQNALVVGLFQVVAILPGLSRSGSTITGGLMQGFNRSLAVKFSFILSIPAILGAAVMEMPGFFASIPDTPTLLCYLAGALAAMLVGILAIKLITWIAEHATFRVFSYYCFAVGVAAIVWGIVA